MAAQVMREWLGFLCFLYFNAVEYLEPSRTSSMEFFAEIAIFAKKLYCRYVRLGSKYASVMYEKEIIEQATSYELQQRSFVQLSWLQIEIT